MLRPASFYPGDFASGQDLFPALDRASQPAAAARSSPTPNALSAPGRAEPKPRTPTAVDSVAFLRAMSPPRLADVNRARGAGRRPRPGRAEPKPRLPARRSPPRRRSCRRFRRLRPRPRAIGPRASCRLRDATSGDAAGLRIRGISTSSPFGRGIARWYTAPHRRQTRSLHWETPAAGTRGTETASAGSGSRAAPPARRSTPAPSAARSRDRPTAGRRLVSDVRPGLLIESAGAEFRLRRLPPRDLGIRAPLLELRELPIILRSRAWLAHWMKTAGILPLYG